MDTQLFARNIGAMHFVGIGGIGMSGIAELLHNLGYTVQGTDLSDSGNVKRLRALGIRVEVGHDAKHLPTPQGSYPACIVVSSAIKPDNPELLEARTRDIPVVRRADMLAELMRLKLAIAVGGTHGKTTTTSMVGTMLEKAGLDPTVVNGGIVQAYGTNTRLGKGEWIVVESDESDGSFTNLPATIAIITNIDPEHMDHYGTFDAVIEAYRDFAEGVPFYGAAIMCIDHPEVRKLAATIKDRQVITYGLSADADVRATNIRAEADGSHFDLVIAPRHGGEGLEVKDMHVPVLGSHNVLNALATFATAWKLQIAGDVMKAAFAEFQGVKRRFTCTGVVNGITVIDDYGHHPVEIRAVLNAAKQATSSNKGKIIAVMQPHRYTRLASLMDEFASCFQDADTVIITDIYTANESPLPGITSDALIEKTRAAGHKDVRKLDSPEALPGMIADIAQNGDYVICLGAGNITAWANALPEQLQAILSPKQAVNG